MRPIAFHDPDHRRALSAALKAVRRRRGRTALDVATALGMPLRSFEHFEAGRGRFDFAKVQKFAKVLGADPFAILAAMQIGSPEFAARAADNKAMLAVLMSLEDLDAALGDGLAELDTALIMAVFGNAVAVLREELRRRRVLTTPTD